MATEKLSWFFENEKDIIDHVTELKSDTSKKTILSAYYILTKSDNAHKLMISTARSVNNDISENKKSNKQKENWISQKAVTDLLIQYKYNAFKIIGKKFVNNKDLLYLRDFMTLWVYTVIPPRRSLDFVHMKIRNIDTNDENYFIVRKKSFVFNSYKTAKTYGKDEVKLENDIDEFIKFYKVWLKVNPTDHLLFDDHFNPLSSSKLTKILNRVFGANVSVNMLRHIYITDQYNSTSKKSVKEVMTDMKDLASDMGHSVETQKQYFKK